VRKIQKMVDRHEVSVRPHEALTQGLGSARGVVT
jgi:hypothetical protein